MSSPASSRPPPDPLLAALADYVLTYAEPSEEAFETARWCLLDTLACGILALEYPACTKLLGPVVPGATLSHGARVPGTRHALDPVQAAFGIGAAIRWLDFNDTWLAAEWGHPSDNLGAILAVTDWMSRSEATGTRPAAWDVPLAASGLRPSPTVGKVLLAMIKAHEIQGVLSLDHAFNRVGLDHVLLVRIASTAVATALLLHPQVRDRLGEIVRIELTTQEPAIRIIDKTGPLHNPADRDHCLQYMTAVALIFGGLTADHYESETARDPRIDLLRSVMVVREDQAYSRDYLDPEKRSIANAVQVFFRDGTRTAKMVVEYPLGHRRRRAEGIPRLIQKAKSAFTARFGATRAAELIALFGDRASLENTRVDDFVGQFVPPPPPPTDALFSRLASRPEAT